jgi:hypothetical protein
MSHRIFLSHKYEDKPVVEPVALRLREIFGEDAIFYDSWSIRPGDGIIEKMNEGLAAPEFVFFFVSPRALESDLVKIEWQNALFSASKGQTRLIPVRISNVEMPPVLRQSLYIDAYANGLETAINQIVNVVQGNSSFTPQHEGFSNLTWSLERASENELVLKIEASHFLEPNPEFVVMLSNDKSEATVGIGDGGIHSSGFYEKPFSHFSGNGFNIKPFGGAITPERPMFIKITKASEVDIVFQGLIHGWSTPFRIIPPSPSFREALLAAPGRK